MVVLHPAILPRFQAAQLVSRRTFVFARAGFGKSNLIKLLFSFKGVNEVEVPADRVRAALPRSKP